MWTHPDARCGVTRSVRVLPGRRRVKAQNVVDVGGTETPDRGDRLGRQARHVHEHVVCGLPEPEPSVHRLAQRRGDQEQARAAIPAEAGRHLLRHPRSEAAPARVGPHDDAANPAGLSRHDALPDRDDVGRGGRHPRVEVAVAEVLQEDDVKGDAPARGAPARRDGGWTLGVTGSA